ncbi:hypothetical protein SAMN05216271_1135 [Halopseudomonas sabulinigri]|uniref:Uncharacterized protein n=1 Tax=Halopseudomonas sabulinigri TaxID=472181 RepID=A0A1H1PD59_9GAMM|nr:hypothetical protein [Halopseudomonas sabulinigri]SDS09172.1 hypothetical protein SAMN05216271_1135 [Halopseudomonas sabulinigri]
MNTQIKLLSAALFSVALLSGLPAVADDMVDREDDRTSNSAIPGVKDTGGNRATGHDAQGMDNHGDDDIGTDRNNALDQNNTIDRDRENGDGATGPAGRPGGSGGAGADSAP